MPSSPHAVKRANVPAPGHVPGAALRLLIWGVLTVAVPVLVLAKVLTGVGFKALPLQSFGDNAVMDMAREIAELRTAKPDYVGIGNSMLYTRLGRTPEKINALTGKKFFLIVKDGTASAAWYLTLKNIVAASTAKPKAVFFFIRDNDITSPQFRTAGKSLTYLNSLRSKREEVLDKVLGAKTKDIGMVDTISDWLNGPTGLFTFKLWDEKVPGRMTEMAMDIGGGGLGKVALRAALCRRFSIENLRGDVSADIPTSDAGGGKRLETWDQLSDNYTATAEDQSLLPAMMAVAQQQGIKLLFFRVKRRPDEQGMPKGEPPEMRGYAQHLKSWIETHGGLFFDESYDPAIQLSDYLDGDHIRPERMAWYQEYFWKRMAGVFP